MFGSDLLGVAVGLILLFLIVSLICSAIRELVEAILKSRAGDLERGIRELLDDREGTEITQRFFQHPFIHGLFGGDYDPAALKGPERGKRMPFSQRRNLPTYIPSGHFASALIDLVYRGPVKSGDVGEAIRQPPLSIAGLRGAAETLPQENVRRIVLAAIDGADGDLDKVKAQIGDWYDGTMDRVSGWYKRKTQIVLFIIGLATAVVLNIDAIEVAKRLYSDKALRDAAVAQAETVARRGTDGERNPGSPEERISALRAELVGIGYPIGWSGLMPDPQTRRDGCRPPDTCHSWDEFGVGGAIQIGLGWFVTALACMLGAPFWFDVLNKIMVIRSTVKPHEKSPEEASEDRQTKSGSRVEVVVRPDGGAAAARPAGG